MEVQERVLNEDKCRVRGKSRKSEFDASSTSKSRLAVDREFMYIGSAGQAAGRRPDGRTDGWKGRFGAQVPIFIAKMKNASKIEVCLTVFLTFRNRRSRKYRFLLFKNQFLGASPDPPDPADPAEMEHELRLATHQQRAGGQDDGSLNKLPQINFFPIGLQTPIGNLIHTRWAMCI